VSRKFICIKKEKLKEINKKISFSDNNIINIENKNNETRCFLKNGYNYAIINKDNQCSIDKRFINVDDGGICFSKPELFFRRSAESFLFVANFSDKIIPIEQYNNFALSHPINFLFKHSIELNLKSFLAFSVEKAYQQGNDKKHNVYSVQRGCILEEKYNTHCFCRLFEKIDEEIKNQILNTFKNQNLNINDILERIDKDNCFSDRTRYCYEIKFEEDYEHFVNCDELKNTANLLNEFCKNVELLKQN
jgi:hypothetical protein